MVEHMSELRQKRYAGRRNPERANSGPFEETFPQFAEYAKKHSVLT
jgi:hypothetical protein